MTKSDGIKPKENNLARLFLEMFKANKPSDTDDSAVRMPPIVGVDPDDGSIVVLDSGRTASFKNGEWQPGVLFHNDQLLDDFRSVDDPAEVARIMKEAAAALRKSAEKP